MNIKTKYNIGDKVWYVDCLGDIENSVVTEEEEGNSRTRGQNLFPTKEALLKSL
jgi:hypothetical protein